MEEDELDKEWTASRYLEFDGYHEPQSSVRLRRRRVAREVRLPRFVVVVVVVGGRRGFSPLSSVPSVPAINEGFVTAEQ